MPLLLAGCERPSSPSLTGPDFTLSEHSGSIGDRVWFDANGNGAQNAGEPGLVGWTVTLLGSGPHVATQTTGANGAYVFTGLRSGSYRVCVQPRQGYAPSWDLDGVLTANCATVKLTRGSTRTDADFGYAQPLGSIGDRVWFDANGDGAQNAGEPGLVGWTVTLLRSGTYVATRTTGANGAYVFTGLPSASYRVCVQPRQGYEPSWDFDGVVTANCAVVNLTPGSARTDADFGYLQPLGSIDDRVWNDANGNRVPDTGEAGLASWIVRISGASLPAGYVTTRSTAPSGAYGFAGLPGGSYQVCVQARPGYTQTFDLDGTATPHCAKLTLSPGQSRSDVDFGYWQPGSLGDRVWNDANGNRAQDLSEAGLAGWIVTISGTALPAGYAASQVAGPTGAYAFPGLPAGAYRVCVAPQAGWTPTYDLDGTGTPHCATVPVVAGQIRSDADFGYKR